MKQFQIIYRDDESFHAELDAIQQWCDTNPAYNIVFRIYSGSMERERVQHVCDILNAKLPNAMYLGCTTNANIIEGALADAEITMTCTIFERETTRVKLMQLPFSEQSARGVVRILKAYCDANPWIKAVELHAAILGMSLRGFCDEMRALREDIQVFGGGACNPNPNYLASGVFSKGNGFTEHGIVFLLLGGEDFYAHGTYIAGWKPLKRKFKVTKAHRQILYELDGKPASHIYQRFLSIDKNDQLITNTLEFPLFMDHNGINVLRCPLGFNEDDSIMLASEVAEGTDVRLAFGDPETILHSIRLYGQEIADFQPEVIQAFSCVARKSFWGDENVSDETMLFNGVAPTSGFYTSGEFLRIDGNLCNFNITLVVIGMREGAPKGDAPVNLYDAKLDNIESEERIPLIRRFVSFIDATATELEELNRKLALASITDGLTRLYKRAEIEQRLRTVLEEDTQLSLIMLDIDNFKRINDIYGHQEGDRVIIALSDVLRKAMADVPSASIGRWGGEEFMILLPQSDISEAVALADAIRVEFAEISYETAGKQTVSVGVIQAKGGEDVDVLYNKVDKALYAAKEAGKNRVVTLD